MSAVARESKEIKETKDADAKPPVLIDVNRLPIEQAVVRLIDHAVKIGSSDLFICSNEQHVAVQVRRLGIVHTISILSSEQAKKCLQHIKANAGMDLTERRRPAEGRWILHQDEGDTIDLRLSVIPTLHGEDIAIRLLTRGNKLYVLESLGMTREQLGQYQAMIGSPSGLILITGPTGSGKTATLYSSLIRLNDGTRKINTIEDPIEYAIDGMRQSQVNAGIDLGFAELLRAILRQAPDIVMVGEIRDEATATTAVHAANSGHMVFATLHSPSAAGAVQSMLSLGAHPHFLSTSLRGVVSQRLIRTLCPNCKTSFDLADAPHVFDEVRPWIGPSEGKALWSAPGCDACNQTGYSARTGVYEVMPITRDLRELIAAGRPAAEIRDKAVAEGMLPFRLAAMLKVAKGESSTEEIFRVIPTEQLLDDR